MHDLKIADSQDPDQPILHIYSSLVKTPATLSHLLSHDVEPTEIDVQRAVLNIARDEQGVVNVARLWDCIRHSKGCVKIVPFSFRDCSVHYRDRYQPTNHNSVSLTRERKLDFRDVDIDVKPIEFQGRDLIDIAVRANGERIHELTFQAYVDRTNQTWMVDLKHVQSEIADDMLEFLPPQVVSKLELAQGFNSNVIARGRIEGEFDSNQIPKFNISAQIEDLSVLNPDLPAAIDHCHARVNMNNQGIEVINAVGRMGESTFNINIHQKGLVSNDWWNVEGWIKNFQFKQDMLSRFPTFCKTFCREYSPEGTSDIQFQISSDGTRDVRAQLTDMSFEYFRFPYKVNHCVGSVHWIGNQIDFHVQGLESEQVIEFQGRINNPGKDVTYLCNIRTLGDLPIDQKLFSAIAVSPKMSSAVRAFRPTGRIRLHRQNRKKRPECALRTKGFRYFVTPMYQPARNV